MPTSLFLAYQLPRRTAATIVPNAVEPDRFDPIGTGPLGGSLPARAGMAEPVLAVVGQISPHKGQSDAIRTLELVRRTASGCPAAADRVGQVRQRRHSV